MSGSLPSFNNAYDMVDVDNVMRVDVARTDEEEAIAGMPKLGDELEGWRAKSIWPLRRPTMDFDKTHRDPRLIEPKKKT
jgi:hypothetical protein